MWCEGTSIKGAICLELLINWVVCYELLFISVFPSLRLVQVHLRFVQDYQKVIVLQDVYQHG